MIVAGLKPDGEFLRCLYVPLAPLCTSYLGSVLHAAQAYRNSEPAYFYCLIFFSQSLAICAEITPQAPIAPTTLLY
jgi:hypothetical protein